MTLDAIARSDGRFLGIVKLEATGTFEELKHLNTLGVRGVRFAFNPQHGGTFDSELFDRTAGWCAELGWQIELHSAPDDLVALAERLARADIPIVIDHMWVGLTYRLAPTRNLFAFCSISLARTIFG